MQRNNNNTQQNRSYKVTYEKQFKQNKSYNSWHRKHFIQKNRYSKMQGGVNKETEKIQIELQWLEHLWDRGNMFERGGGVIRAYEWYS